METFATGLRKIKTLCSESGVKYEFKKEEYGFTVIFYRHCGEGWGWSADAKDNASDNVAQDVAQEKDLEKIIYDSIRADRKVTRENMAAKAGVSVKTVERKLKELNDIKYIGTGSNGHWEITEQDEQ